MISAETYNHDYQVAYEQGREDGIDSAISNALWYLWAAHIEVDQKSLQRYVKKMCAEELKEQI